MNLSERDKKHNWHPYTQHKTAQDFPAIVKGKDALLWDENGKEYIDAIASWWVNPYGHSNTIIADAIYKQLTTLEHVLFGGFTHDKAVELSEKLMEILPSNQQKIFYSDNGSTAVEIAIKSALQYNYNKGIKKTKVIAFEDAFHGDTFGAMAASGISFFTEAFKGSLLEVVRIPVPTFGNEEKALQVLENLVKTNDFAAFIFEPLVLGAAGMVMYQPEVLDKMIAICNQNNVFTIADEVMTGFGKTGKTFATDYLENKPDMMCLSKALTGGTIPMAITTFTQEIFDGFYDDDTNKALFHGHTFTANPTGCAAALASIDLLHTNEMQDNIQRVHQSHLTFETKIKNHPKVKTTRVLGVIFALEVKTDTAESYYGTMRTKLYNFFIENGVILRPVGNIIYILPPYIITENQLQKVYQTIENALEIV
ncbi:adenosylmethionine--8-amino-7-oxononanoate transaminase [Flavobacterium aquatile]|uniref:Adenosylmethionine-8-amino-7-oxononanoate aminotransferase n=1 Tax=Flavobacterium aquatile LMG 4008 = ATCC 11947 TaxID=1453498 RepID=A0A095SWB9_9FLAO|nr:adenosylmethionine--8-amino-7-oxononanoate transaminase [Flavobacterium aquatile]KGD68971.1 adenosylmethionine-8-amino-7-oxononanoate aminotransferase [Flavobacterium aquatile LMG 4008 = ATCC 11947]OXA65682.1 adenosylmethionine--8-amino-7-oxononanoate aminotransferase BioA [Flavobacterium aquatile LMG 4008 = ATCC 11947]GEC79620.1 adenosylmethionine--8-amino-7-oxononanoate aminotransferase BioA [Flavobacterium aquatile]